MDLFDFDKESAISCGLDMNIVNALKQRNTTLLQQIRVEEKDQEAENLLCKFSH